ncbi:hypothetical protein JX266_008970 [Neoarthrinium moseri]|nr:hypothetical protein JX266_008970 [Neoarthrinium moseri]
MAQDEDDRSPLMFNITVTLLAVSSVTVALRCYVRLYVIKSFRWEDWMALVTMTFFACYCTCVFLSIKHGAGKHLSDIPPEDIPEALKARWFGEIAYILTSVFLKLTVGLFLLRICSRRWQSAAIWAVLAVVLAFNIFYFLIALLQCRPIGYFWLRVLPTTPRGTCVSEEVATGSTYAASAVNAFADWVLGLLPVALVWNLELSRRSKISIAAILGLGVIASSATLIRIPYVWQLTHDADFLYVFTDFLIWSTVENGLGLIASSIATLRPLFRKPVDPTRGHYRSTTIRASPRRQSSRLSIRSTAFHCRGLSDQGDVEMAETGGQYGVGRARITMAPQAHVREKRTERATYDHNSGWSWDSAGPGWEDSIHEWRNSSKSQLMSGSKRSTL